MRGITFMLCALLSLAGCAGPQPPTAPRLHDATTPVTRAGWALERHESINARVAELRPELIFIGDSITQAWEAEGREVWETSYAPRHAANLGISADRTQHVLWRLEHGNIDGISPKVAVVMIGTNNSGDDTPDQIADGITAIVRTLRLELPATRVLLLAIFPRGADDSNPWRQTNMKVNAIISGLADGRMVSYVDIGPSFLAPDGTLSRDVMPDLLHLSEKGYAIWAEAMEPELARLLAQAQSSR